MPDPIDRTLKELGKRSKESAPLIVEHTKLMEDAYHGGWAVCRCELARKIRTTLDIPERERSGLRIRLDNDDFNALVQGRIITKTADGKRVLLILEDMGFDQMMEAVVLASRAAS